MRLSEDLTDTAPQIWSQVWLPYELMLIGASFGTLSALMAIEVWKKVFVLLSPRSP